MLIQGSCDLATGAIVLPGLLHQFFYAHPGRRDTIRHEFREHAQPFPCG
jgi:hypothetical protein